jgi:hypothetical protein
VCSVRSCTPFCVPLRTLCITLDSFLEAARRVSRILRSSTSSYSTQWLVSLLFVCPSVRLSFCFLSAVGGLRGSGCVLLLWEGV